MDIVRSESDLEDGEIRDEVLEDISDCSLSDIIHEESSDGNNVDSLRNEALKSLPVEQPANEEEKCRLEALKSLLENTGFLNENEESLQAIEDLTEEEKFRVEAVKSLLRNINFLTTKNTPPPVANRTKKRKRRRKIRKTDSPQKRAKVKEEPVEENKPNVTYLEETTSLLSELTEDVKKINECIESKKPTKSPDKNLVNKENTNENDSIDSSPTVINSVRSWYPKTEFTLSDISFTRNITVNRKNRDDGHKLKVQSNNSRDQKLESEPIANHSQSQKTKLVSERSESGSTEIAMKLDKLPNPELLNDNITVELKVEESVTSEEPLVSKPALKTENKSVSNKSTQPTCDFQQTKKLKKVLHRIIKPNVLIRSPKSKSISPKISTPCSFRKFNSTQPVPNGKPYSLVRKAVNRYKLNNVPASKYSVKKTSSLKIDTSKLKLNNGVKSRYSINRTNQYSKVNPKEFIIPLDDDDRDDSSKEEDVPTKPVVVVNASEARLKIIPSSQKNVEKELPKIKEEPREVSEELPNDEFPVTESPSTTTADPLILVKEEPVPGADDPFDVGNIEIGEVSSLRCDTSSCLSSQDLPPPSNDNPETKSEIDLLFEAEENLIEIRSKLLSSLSELDTTNKTNAQETEKLLNMVKKLNALKAAVARFEEKIKTQRMKLAMSNSFAQSLYEGVMLRSKTCSKMKDLCSIAGKNIVGPLYRPPEDFEAQLEEKQKTLDFSKYVRKAAEKK